MPVSPHLHRKLREALGADAGADLAALLESIEGLRGDVAELRHDMQLLFERMEAFGARVAVVENRLPIIEAKLGEIGSTVSRFEAALERGFKEQTRFVFLAWSVLLATIVGLYAR